MVGVFRIGGRAARFGHCIDGPDPVGADTLRRLTGQQTQCRTAHRTRRLRHAPRPCKRHTWCQRVVDRIRGTAAGPDNASCLALPPSRNPALPPFRNTPTNKPLSALGGIFPSASDVGKQSRSTISCAHTHASMTPSINPLWQSRTPRAISSGG